MDQIPVTLLKESPLEEFLATLPLKYRTMVAIAYFTSSKISDILSLKLSDIDAHKIAIFQSESASIKLAPIDPLLRPYLSIYLNALTEHSSDFIFTNALGELMNSWSVFQVLKRVASQINLPELYLFVLR